jgi:two-component system NtrC family response regulator
MTLRRLLVVEDDLALRKQLRWSLDAFDVHEAGSREQALAILRAEEPSVVLLDLGLPPDAGGVSEGFATLGEVLALAPATKVIVMTGQEGRQHALAAIAAGAHDYHNKPVDPDHLALLLGRAFHVAELEAENVRLMAQGAGARSHGMIGDSPAMLQLYRALERAGPTDISVTLLGESGTGKELAAQALHEASPRRHNRFVAINCAAIPPALLEAELFGYERGAFTGAYRQTPGKIELAQGGTLFLDEIGDLSMELQAKLLRFLQERVVERLGGRQEIAVDVRVISATHRDLADRIAAGLFREDLYYRLAEISIVLPPLRERPGDAILLARHLLARFGEELGKKRVTLLPEALAAIDAYAWPGNVRELQNRLKRAIIMCEGRRIGRKDLDLAVDDEDYGILNLRQVRERAEIGALRRALARAEGNVSKTARLLGVSRPTLYDLLRTHGLRD